MTRALVLGGGGVTGIAWEIGILKGLRDGGVDLTGADLVIGTSAGSVVGTQVCTGRDLDELYAEQTAPVDPSQLEELGSGNLDEATLARMAALMLLPGSAVAKRRRLGTAAIKAHPEPATERLRVIRLRVGEPAWPDRDLRIAVVDAHTGVFRLFDQHSGVPLVEAVAASCAVPLVWPPVPVGDATYVDGGVRSSSNADQAVGADTVVVIAPLPQAATRRHSLDAQLARTGATRTAQVVPDEGALAAIGPNVLDPTRRAASAEAGNAQARDLITRITPVWTN